ncbi:hypothetical protein [Criblamydia sequanensis]|uniref:Uncharacterized protein n=1 Tax=Candidatus Criblamydia sequanensis CRIB-18 TaxID=1437425 RepID=A0A090D2A6_9BACT|nr:hypothetical protein [Criblamydia sequanensis]CDR34178.1 hypothetical protein CSEC_1358 [Criblamydia sequanensis CRIB-18]
MEHRYNDHVAGAKTKWIIEFLEPPSSSEQKPKVHFLIPYPPNTPENRDNMWLDTSDLKNFENKFNKFLGVINDLCNSLDEACKKSIQEGDYSQDIKDQAESLSDLVERFNEFFKKLKDEPGDPPVK